MIFQGQNVEMKELTEKMFNLSRECWNSACMYDKVFPSIYHLIMIWTDKQLDRVIFRTQNDNGWWSELSQGILSFS